MFCKAISLETGSRIVPYRFARSRNSSIQSRARLLASLANFFSVLAGSLFADQKAIRSNIGKIGLLRIQNGVFTLDKFSIDSG